MPAMGDPFEDEVVRSTNSHSPSTTQWCLPVAASSDVAIFTAHHSVSLPPGSSLRSLKSARLPNGALLAPTLV
jgi:hypothetical protein